MTKETKKTEVKEEIKKEEVKKSGKGAIIAIIVIVLVLAIVGGGSFAAIKLGLLDSITGGGDNGTTIKLDNKEKVNIKKVDNTIEYEQYDNGLVKFDIPKGWKVEVAPTDYIHYAFKAYNPENPTYMFLFNLKQEGALKSEKARQTYAKLYPDAPFSKITPIDPQTTEGYYKAYVDGNAKYCNDNLGVSFLPIFKDFKVVEDIGNDMMGGDILRATFTDSNGKKAQGLFTAAVKSSGTYMINENIWDLMSAKVDVAPLNTYNIMMMTAPEEEFMNYQAALDHCLASIEFSQTFINGFNSEESTLTSTIIANQKVYDSMSDMIMDSWNKRNTSEDILSQKRSDATLGYERVYDTETGDIYKAYNGFTDDYHGDRYKTITDDMYTQATAGYIEK